MGALTDENPLTFEWEFVKGTKLVSHMSSYIFIGENMSVCVCGVRKQASGGNQSKQRLWGKGQRPRGSWYHLSSLLSELLP